MIDCFWEPIVDADVDMSWLVNVRNHLDKTDKEQGKTKRKNLAGLSRNYHFKRMVLEWFDEHLSHFQFKSDCLSYFFLEFENLCTLATIRKTSKHPKGERPSSQTCQDDINLTEVLNEQKKRNDSLDSKRNCSEPGTQANNHQDINQDFIRG